LPSLGSFIFLPQPGSNAPVLADRTDYSCAVDLLAFLWYNSVL